MPNPWEELGNRVVRARKDAGLTQAELASAVELERTAITKIENGQRTVDSLELARLASALRRPIAWFVATPPPSVVSRRAEREVSRFEDVQLEMLAQDVEQIIALGALNPPALSALSATSQPVASIAETEVVAQAARRAAGLAAGEPVWDIVRVAERLGLYAFVLASPSDDRLRIDGSYVALARGGVALIGGAAESIRRRFTIAHELGHHILADEYASEWVVDAGGSEREKIINAFAIHFLMPRSAIDQRWREFGGGSDARDAAIRVAVEFGTSWSATCAQLARARCISEEQAAFIAAAKPTSFEYAERGLRVRDDVIPPLIPPMYAAAVVNLLKRGKLGASRVLELLHGTVLARDLPVERVLTLEAIAADLEPLPA